MRVVKSFDARKLCEARTYEYLLPLSVLVPDPLSRPEPNMSGPDDWQTGVSFQVGRSQLRSAKAVNVRLKGCGVTK